jgi:hypothetical protein
LLNCPNCNRIIVDTTNDGGVKVRSRMILIHGDTATAICPSCKTTISVPLMIDVSKLPPSNKPQHFVQR